MSGRYFQLYCFFIGIGGVGWKWDVIFWQAFDFEVEVALVGGQKRSVKDASAMLESQVEGVCCCWFELAVSAGGQSTRVSSMLFEGTTEAFSIETSLWRCEFCHVLSSIRPPVALPRQTRPWSFLRQGVEVLPSPSQLLPVKSTSSV